ncbi:MAG: DNA-processing protein DprA [Candidatus Omnitrophota bacterium]
MSEKEALIILNAIPGLGNKKVRKFIEHFGSAREVLSLKTERLTAENIPEQVAKNISSFPKEEFLKKEFKLLAEQAVQVMSYQDEDYPARLKEIPDAPILLYIKGVLGHNHPLSLAMVGSRRASLYGLKIAEKFASALGELGITIISGMARGIDTAAHRGALRAKGKTIAVLGCGLAHVYPPENKKLMGSIIDNGAVISEFPMTTLPFGFNFPRRNRIISGLSLGVIVVEAAAKSGALITSEFALEQGREVFAVPGEVDTPNSRGVNHLIKQGAKLVTCIEDILEELSLPLHAALEDTQEKKILPQETEALGPQEREIIEQLGPQPVHIDELSWRVKLPINFIMAALLRLELKGLIKQLPGKLFVAPV